MAQRSFQMGASGRFVLVTEHTIDQASLTTLGCSIFAYRPFSPSCIFGLAYIPPFFLQNNSPNPEAC
jgi:hypothetical protein